MDTLAHSEYFRQFLLATGRSDFSSGAERVSIAMAEKCGATLIGMTMVFSNPELDAIAPERAEVADEDACNYLDRLCGRLCTAQRRLRTAGSSWQRTR